MAGHENGYVPIDFLGPSWRGVETAMLSKDVNGKYVNLKDPQWYNSPRPSTTPDKRMRYGGTAGYYQWKREPKSWVQ